MAVPHGEFEKPIPCPECKQLLKTVQVEKVTVLEWHEAEKEPIGETAPGAFQIGHVDTEETVEDEYYEENGQGSTIVRCYKCGKVIGAADSLQSWGIYPKSEEY